MPICVYFLENKTCSYIGYTVNLQRRLRQHRKELAGGAKYTSKWQHVKLVSCVSGFPDKRTAMSYEWHAKRRRGPTQVIYQGTHSRLWRFYEPLLLAKFKTCKSDLSIQLSGEHSTHRMAIQERYQVPTTIIQP
jgi:predicted GIY-YIG superfamily endonuclease